MSDTSTAVAKLRAEIEAGKAEARRVWLDEFNIDIAVPGAKHRIAAAVRSGLIGATTPEQAAKRIGASLRREGGRAC